MFGVYQKGICGELQENYGVGWLPPQESLWGQLLATVGVDANDGMYPVAWAIVET